MVFLRSGRAPGPDFSSLFFIQMTSEQTLNYCIETLEAELEDLAMQIQEETNFEHNSLDFLSEQYDVTESHLINLKNLLESLIPCATNTTGT